MLQDHLAVWIEDKANIEKAIFDLGMTRFCLSHNKGIVLSGNLAELVRLFAGNINGAFSSKLHMIEVEDFIIKGLQRTFGEGNESNRKIQAGKPGSSFDEVREMFEVMFDISAGANPSHRRNESNCSVRFNHSDTPLLCRRPQ